MEKTNDETDIEISVGGEILQWKKDGEVWEEHLKMKIEKII